MASKKKRKTQVRPAAAEPLTPGSKRRTPSTKPKEDRSLRKPWSRPAVATLMGAALISSLLVLSYLFGVMQEAQRSELVVHFGSETGFIVNPEVVTLPMFGFIVFFETPMRRLLRQRRMGFFEVLATGAVAYLAIYACYFLITQLNAPTTSGGPGSNSAPSASASVAASATTAATPSPTATSAPTATPSPAATATPRATANPGATPSANPGSVSKPPEPRADTSPTTAATKQVPSAIASDVAGFILFIWLYPKVYGLFLNPAAGAAARQKADAEKKKAAAGKGPPKK